MSDKSQMRLLSINNYYYRRGGAEVIFLEQNKLFEAIDWDVPVFSMQHPENLPSPWSEYFVSEIEYGRAVSLPAKLSQAGKIIYSFEAQRNLTALIERARPDIAHAHNIYHHLSPSVLSTLKQQGIPTVMTAHDLKLACPAYSMMVKGQICEACKGGKIYNVVRKRCIKNSLALSSLILTETAIHRMLGLYRKNLDRIVVPSRFYRNKLIEWGWPEQQLTYIPNFVATDHLKPGWERRDYFLFVGRLSPEKGLITLIKAAAKAGQKLVIAGAGPQEGELRALVEELNADVVFAGYVSGKSLHQLIGEALALVLPSECYENAPVSVLEAYALGTPAIGASTGGIPELIRVGETGFLSEMKNVEDLAEQLSRMAALSAGQRDQMGSIGREWVLENFSDQAYRNRMLSLYQDLGVRV